MEHTKQGTGMKRYLQGIGELNDQIDRKIRKLDEMRAMSTATGSPDYAKERVQTSPSPDAPHIRMAEKMFDLDQEINADIDRLAGMKETADRAMAGIPERQKKVIRCRYFDRMKWEEIADVLGCSVRKVHYIHSDALGKMGETTALPSDKKITPKYCG